VITRLYFENLGIRQVAALAHELERQDPTLSVAAVSLANRRPDTSEFDVELGVAYRVFSPQRSAGDSKRP